MSEPHSYDVFISYARADRAWARAWLLQRLDAAGVSTHTEEQFAIGIPKLINRERAVDASRRTLIVLTPAWLADSLNDFEALLTQTNDPAGRQAKLLPLLLKPCQPPPTLVQDQGDYAAARIYYDRALAIKEAKLGPEHPSTASTLHQLGRLLYEEGDHAGARPYFERAVSISEQALGPQHSFMATSLTGLAMVLRAQGNYAAARMYHERALAIREKVLGSEHPDTALSLNNLALLCYNEGDIAEAARLMRRALDIRERVLGPRHPDTVNSRESLEAIEERLARGQGDAEAQ